MSAHRIAISLLLLSLVATACSFDDASEGQNTTPGWSLGDDQGNDQSVDQPGSPDMTPPTPDQGGQPDQAPPTPDMMPDQAPPQPDMPAPEPDMPAPEPDMQEPEPDMPGGSLDEDSPCVRTAECAGSLQCCPDLSGLNLCKPQSACFTGGVCLVDQECPGNQQCCDFSQLGLPQKICRDSCPGSPGGPGGPGGPGNPTPACQHNGECAQSEVCCPSFSGATSCTPVGQCATGSGTCTQDSHCGPNLQCCRIGQISSGLCLTRCGI